MPAGGKRKEARVYPYLLAALLAVGGAERAAAQFAQYRMPGTLDPHRELERDLDQKGRDARWRLGPLFVEPLATLRNVGWEGNLYASADDREAVSDLHATAGLGAVSYLHFGRKMVLTGFALPEYAWWHEQEQLRELHWNWGLRLQGGFNRLATDLLGRRVERERYLNSELEVRALTTSESVQLDFEVDLRGPFAVHGTLAATEVRSRIKDPAALATVRLADLDREERVARLSLRYRLRNGLEIGLGAESLDTDFLQPGAARSNRAAGPLLLLALEGGRGGLLVTAAAHTLDFDGGPERQRLTGDAQIDLRLTSRLTLTPNAHRSVIYSALDNQSVFYENRSGLVVQHRTTGRLRLSAFYERGDNEFETVDERRTTRVDNFALYGAGFELELTPRSSLQLRALHLDYESALPELNRSWNRITTGIELTSFDLLPD